MIHVTGERWVELVVFFWGKVNLAASAVFNETGCNNLDNLYCGEAFVLCIPVLGRYTCPMQLALLMTSS